VTYPGFTPVGNATLVVANVLTCNKHSLKEQEHTHSSHVHLPCIRTCMTNALGRRLSVPVGLLPAWSLAHHPTPHT
jgi:hypothetical protein